MTTVWTYDFGYSWPVAWGHAIPAAVFGGLLALGLWRHWRPWLVIGSGALTAWAFIGMVIVQGLVRINLPLPLPTERFMASDAGTVLDVGAGSGRATVGLLLARPHIRATAVDIYSGYYGIDDNSPERLQKNARAAGVADRVVVQVGDARELPFPGASFDGVISAAAIDHIDQQGIDRALAEVLRVLKPGGQFLLEVVKVDGWVHLAMPAPHGLAHHLPQDPERWRIRLEAKGFELVEEGTRPATLYFLCRKPA